MADETITRRDRQVMREACPGCRYDRYNQGRGYCERPGIDVPVTCSKCWHVSSVPYNRSKRRYECGLNVRN